MMVMELVTVIDALHLDSLQRCPGPPLSRAAPACSVVCQPPLLAYWVEDVVADPDQWAGWSLWVSSVPLVLRGPRRRQACGPALEKLMVPPTRQDLLVNRRELRVQRPGAGGPVGRARASVLGRASRRVCE